VMPNNSMPLRASASITCKEGRPAVDTGKEDME
jgi:hypothetical protein